MSFSRVRSLLSQAELDGLVATSYENVAHMSGAVIMTQRSIPERLAAVVLSHDADPTMVICTIEEAQVRRDSRISDIRGYTEFATSPTETIAEVLREKGLDRGRVGIEMRVLSAHYYQELRELLPEVSFEPADKLLDRVRMIKTPEEIALLERAALATDRAIRSAYEIGDVGISDKVVADALANGIQSSGADSVAFLVLGAGPSAALAHPVPLDRPLEEGDIVRCDVGGYYSGYLSDLARSAVVGEPSAEQRRLYENLWQIHEETLASVRPGIRASDLFHTCEKAFKQRGMTLSLPHIGHSMGLGLHENPMLSPFDDTVLEENMVIAIEPAHKEDGPILHVEDLIAVTADGGRILSRSADWSELFVINGRSN
jgi:Xaa-Pro dipeptidase